MAIDKHCYVHCERINRNNYSSRDNLDYFFLEGLLLPSSVSHAFCKRLLHML
jgi:hypothetical protein